VSPGVCLKAVLHVGIGALTVVCQAVGWLKLVSVCTNNCVGRQATSSVWMGKSPAECRVEGDFLVFAIAHHSNC
jgi:hypothetical protein